MGEERRGIGLTYITATVCRCRSTFQSLLWSPQPGALQLSCHFPIVKETCLVLLALERDPLTNITLLIEFTLWGKKKKKAIKLASWPAAVERK